MVYLFRKKDDNKKYKEKEKEKEKDIDQSNEQVIQNNETQLLSKNVKGHRSRITFNSGISTNWNDVANTVLFLAVFIGIWQVIYLSGIFPKVSLPSPLMVAESFVELIQSNTLFSSMAMTLYRLVIGFGASIGIGVAVGLAMVKFNGFGKTMGSFAMGLQSFPSVAWVPFAILLIGLNDAGILFVVIMSSVFSVMMSTYSGIRNVPPIYMRAAKNMGAKGLRLFRYLMIPAATPALIIGVKQAWSFAWHALIGAEILIAATVGIGHILLVGREFQLMNQVIASMITIFALGMLFDRVLFNKIEDKVREKWGLRQEQENQ